MCVYIYVYTYTIRTPYKTFNKHVGWRILDKRLFNRDEAIVVHKHTHTYTHSPSCQKHALIWNRMWCRCVSIYWSILNLNQCDAVANCVCDLFKCIQHVPYTHETRRSFMLFSPQASIYEYMYRRKTVFVGSIFIHYTFFFILCII